MSWTGKPCPFTIQILIKITIFKRMALHGTLVCDSENWCTYQTWFVLSSGVFYSCVCWAAVPWQRSITFLVRSLVNNKIQGISLAEKLTVWRHICYGGWLVWDSQNIYECSRRIITCFSFHLCILESAISELLPCPTCPPQHTAAVIFPSFFPLKTIWKKIRPSHSCFSLFTSFFFLLRRHSIINSFSDHLEVQSSHFVLCISPETN